MSLILFDCNYVVESLNHSFGIETIGSTMAWIIQQGTMLPCSGEEIFTNSQDNQSATTITLKQGDDGKY